MFTNNETFKNNLSIATTISSNTPEAKKRVSEQAKSQWANEETRNKIIKSLVEATNTEEAKKNRSILTTLAWKDNNERKEKQSIDNAERWKNEEYRNKTTESIIKVRSTPESRAKTSKQAITQWSDEIMRAKMIQGLIDGTNTEEAKRNYSEANKLKWLNEDYRDNMVNNMIELWKTDEFRDKVKEGNIKVFGVEHRLLVDQIFEDHTRYKYKEYVMPSGKTVKIQGYENFALDYLLTIYEESDIIVGAQNIRNEIGKVQYFTTSTGSTISYTSSTSTGDTKFFINSDYTENNVSQIKHRYYPDFYIKSKHKIVEVKSTWTYLNQFEINCLKRDACLNNNIDFDFLILTERNSNKFKEIININPNTTLVETGKIKGIILSYYC